MAELNQTSTNRLLNWHISQKVVLLCPNIEVDSCSLGETSEEPSDIIQGGRMTSFCKCFSSVWFGLETSGTLVSHDFQQLLLNSPLLEGGNISPHLSLYFLHVINIFPRLAQYLVSTLLVLFKLVSKWLLKIV